MKKMPLIVLLALCFFLVANTRCDAQKPEIGFSIVLSGAILSDRSRILD